MNVYLPNLPDNGIDDEALLQSAIHQHANGDLVEARTSYGLMLRADPKNLIANHLSGVLEYQEGRLERAYQFFSLACNINPNYPESLFYRGVVLASTHRQEAAVADFDQVLLLQPDHAEALFNKGLALVDLGDMSKAQEAFEKAILARPGYLKALFNLGNVLKSQQKFDEALIAYSNALSFDSNYYEALINRGNTLLALGLPAEAISDYEHVVSISPNCGEAAHMLSALKGQTTASVPLAYVEKLFDAYAPTFEHDLLKNLHYKVPELIGHIVGHQQRNEKMFSVVDLGCGTGLVGFEIRQCCDWLVGVDISKLMLSEADKKAVYNKLEKCDVFDFLSNATLDFDYFIAADVFIYLGELSEVFYLIKSRNNRAGKFIFSIEKSLCNRFFLERSGRYSHSQVYIEHLCEEFDFQISFYMDIEVRKERDQFVSGALYVLDF